MYLNIILKEMILKVTQNMYEETKHTNIQKL